jgi:hypothetical protein
MSLSLEWAITGSEHWLEGEYAKAYPDAKLIGVEGLAEKKEKEGLKLNGCRSGSILPLPLPTRFCVAYGVDPAGTLYGYEDEVCCTYLAHGNVTHSLFFRLKHGT